jgi:hypothetical protein
VIKSQIAIQSSLSRAAREKLKNDTVFKPYRRLQYNKNRDEWITADKAPELPPDKIRRRLDNT